MWIFKLNENKIYILKYKPKELETENGERAWEVKQDFYKVNPLKNFSGFRVQDWMWDILSISKEYILNHEEKLFEIDPSKFSILLR